MWIERWCCFVVCYSVNGKDGRVFGRCNVLVCGVKVVVSDNSGME